MRRGRSCRAAGGVQGDHGVAAARYPPACPSPGTSRRCREEGHCAARGRAGSRRCRQVGRGAAHRGARPAACYRARPEILVGRLRPTPPARWEEVQRELAAATTWVLDGDLGPYHSLQPRLANADTVVILEDEPVAAPYEIRAVDHRDDVIAALAKCGGEPTRSAAGACRQCCTRCQPCSQQTAASKSPTSNQSATPLPTGAEGSPIGGG